MQIGIGFSRQTSSLQAGQEAASLASQLQPKSPQLVLAFCNHALNPQDVYLGIRAVVGAEIPIIGGSAIGIIGNDCLITEGPAVVVASLSSHHIRCHHGHANGLFKDPLQTGRQLGEQLAQVPLPPQLMLLLYDSIRYPAGKFAPAVLNPSNLLLQGLAESTLEVPMLAGAGLLGDHRFQSSWQFTGFDVARHHAVALLLSGPVASVQAVMHGCTPVATRRYRISSIHGQFLYQLDGRPALQVIDEALGGNHWRAQAPIRELCLGRRLQTDDKLQPQYLNRLISGILPEQDGLVLFEDDLAEGDEVLLMRRAPELALQAAAEQTAALLAGINQSGQQPLLALYINCGGRAVPNEQAETREIQRQLNQANIPLLGFYSGVELAPIQGQTRGLDWSGVLTILCRSKPCLSV